MNQLISLTQFGINIKTVCQLRDAIYIKFYDNL